MNTKTNLPDTPGEVVTTQKLLEDKLAQLQAFEKEVPAVYIVHSFPDFSVTYMSQRGLDVLGISLDEIRLTSTEYHSRYFNTAEANRYVPKIAALIEKNNMDEMITYFQQVRPSPAHNWNWYLSSTKIFLQNAEGKPAYILTMAIPIDVESHINTKVERLLEENNFLHKNQHIYSSLTRREKEILAMMALGKSSAEIAAEKHISEKTAMTHRRNIRAKINAQSGYDLTRFAQAFDLI